MCKLGIYSVFLVIFSYMVVLFLLFVIFNLWIWIEFFEKYRGEVYLGFVFDLVCIFLIYNYRLRFNIVDC